MSVRITDIPRTSRPRERLQRLGLVALSDLELIALVIRSGKVGESALETAARLLAHHGGLKRLSEARPEELSNIAGIGIAKASSLLAGFELGRRASLAETSCNSVRAPGQLASIAALQLTDPTREELVAIVLGPGHKLIRVVPISVGGAACCIVPIREILAAVLRNDGVAFALVHNHPSGELRPSAEDLASTRSVVDAAERAGIRLLDHVIVSGSRWLSLRQSGFLEAVEPDDHSMEGPVERT